MPLPKPIRQSLSYLRKRYKVSERDLVSLARKIQPAQEEQEQSWEQIVAEYKAKRKRRRY